MVTSNGTTHSASADSTYCPWQQRKQTLLCYSEVTPQQTMSKTVLGHLSSQPMLLQMDWLLNLFGEGYQYFYCLTFKQVGTGSAAAIQENIRFSVRSFFFFFFFLGQLVSLLPPRTLHFFIFIFLRVIVFTSTDRLTHCCEGNIILCVLLMPKQHLRALRCQLRDNSQ